MAESLKATAFTDSFSAADLLMNAVKSAAEMVILPPDTRGFSRSWGLVPQSRV
jgi:hypothetical protein